MTLSTRHKITYLLLSVSLLVNGALIFFFITRFEELVRLFPLTELNQKWWLLNSIPRESSFLTSLAGGAALSITSLLCSISLMLAFRRSPSQEVFYVQLFLLSLSFFSLKFLSYLVPYYHLPLGYTVIITRMILFFRFNSLLFLVLSGLSVFDSRFQKSDPFFLSAVIISLSLAATIPLSDRFIQNTLTLLPINEMNLFFLFLIVELIIPINFLWFFYQRKTLDYLLLTLSMVLFICAENFFFYVTPGGVFAGIILLLGGSLLFSRRIYRLYLWR